ncbi:uncharacterized protein LOC120683231 isoform X2 [Panicum virgatum]|uniref:uncharacterized protein LOC120683231 isoform X2 n=1 Tax=Panicum virgatum TaxID=38727 RepID=UPI0019D5E35E|nr:uncharacterized protein LOC120683231 isoform X2 [Panicum virgatum]
MEKCQKFVQDQMSECQKLLAMAEKEGCKPPEGQEVLALREQVSKLAVDKEALEERVTSQLAKHKDCHKKQRELRKSLKIQENLVLDLKLLMYRRTDEIEKLQKMKADYDVQLVEMFQQVKDLSESRASL